MKSPPPARVTVSLVVLVALATLGCGSRARGGAAQPPRPPPQLQQQLPVAAKTYPAARWIPARPTYALAARSVGDAQGAAGDLLASFGAHVGFDVRAASSLVVGLLGIDALAADALAEIGVDAGGSLALFS